MYLGNENRLPTKNKKRNVPCCNLDRVIGQVRLTLAWHRAPELQQKSRVPTSLSLKMIKGQKKSDDFSIQHPTPWMKTHTNFPVRFETRMQRKSNAHAMPILVMRGFSRDSWFGLSERSKVSIYSMLQDFEFFRLAKRKDPLDTCVSNVFHRLTCSFSQHAQVD